MPLRSGQIAPDFTVQDIDGNTIRLADYEGKKLLICFFRYAGCPFCNLMLHSFIERYPKLHAHGLEVLAFVQSSRESILDYPMQRQQPRPPFPLIPDPTQEVYRLYDVEPSARKFVRGVLRAPLLLAKLYQHHFPQGKVDGSLLLMPAFFLVSAQGLKIHAAYYSPDFSTMIPDVDIINFVSDTQLPEGGVAA